MSRNPALDLPKSQMYRDMAALGFYDLEGWTMVRNEMRAYQYGFQTMLELNDRVREDWWPLTCSRERLEEWEGLLALPPRPQASLEARRKGALAFLALGTEGRGQPGAAALEALTFPGIWVIFSVIYLAIYSGAAGAAAASTTAPCGEPM